MKGRLCCCEPSLIHIVGFALALLLVRDTMQRTVMRLFNCFLCETIWYWLATLLLSTFISRAAEEERDCGGVTPSKLQTSWISLPLSLSVTPTDYVLSKFSIEISLPYSRTYWPWKFTGKDLGLSYVRSVSRRLKCKYFFRCIFWPIGY